MRAPLPGPGCFVAGTDTGVGKTTVACALARGLRAGGADVGVMKPVETGADARGPLDALALREAAGVDDPIEWVCPQRFTLPAAPSVAAAHEGRAVDLAALQRAFDALSARHGFLLVEGAGGLRVPVTREVEMIDLATLLGLPVLLVARAALGTINHTLLSLEALESRRLPLAGVVISHADGALSDADAENLDALRRELGERKVGELPPLAPGARAAPTHDVFDWARLTARLAAAPERGRRRSA